MIERRADPSRAPLAFTQEQLWFLDQLNPGRATYNIAVVMRLRGALDQAAVERAVSALVERHEPMRTRLAVEDGQPLQVIEPPGGFELLKEDWSARPEEERERMVHLVARGGLEDRELVRGEAAAKAVSAERAGRNGPERRNRPQRPEHTLHRQSPRRRPRRRRSDGAGP